MQKQIIKTSLFLLFLLPHLLSCKKNFPDGGTYQPPAFLKIEGPVTVAANSTQSYYTYYLDNGNYVWTVPDGAQITSSPQQGKSTITVKFGTKSGKLSVTAKGMTTSVDVVVQ